MDRLGEEGKVYRLITTLLNPLTAPALTLVELYHERWEIELVIDEIKTHERAQRKVLRSKTPQGVRQELLGIFLAHYRVRVLMAQAAQQGKLDPDRLRFTEGLFHLSEMIDLALVVEPEATPALLKRLYERLARKILPPRSLHIPRSAQRDVARSEAAEKCASLQRKNMTIPTGRRNHDQYRRFSRHHPGLFAICSLDASLIRKLSSGVWKNRSLSLHTWKHVEETLMWKDALLAIFQEKRLIRFQEEQLWKWCIHDVVA